MNKRPALLLTMTALCLSPWLPECRAGKVKVWHQHTPANYEKAQWKDAVISSEGVLRLARLLRPLTALDAEHLWDVAEDAAGNLYAAAGGEGKVWKITPDGKAAVAWHGEEGQVLCLAVAADGTVYAGTGPAGRIIRIDARGVGRVLCETGESYVWSLALDAKSGALFAGTGPNGRILRVTPEGKASVFYAAKQEHILCLAAGDDGALFAGTDKGGLVYRIDAKGKGFVLHQVPQAEVRCLRVTPEALYVGTSAPTKRHGGGSTAGAPIGRESTVRTPVLDKGTFAVSTSSGGKASAAEENSFEKGSPAPAPSTPAKGENSVYRITPDGAVREVFREKAMVMSVLKQGGRLFVGTGMDGQLFEADEATRERSEIARLDHGQVLSMLRRKDDSLVVATGDPGKLYVLQNRYAARGTVTSDVLDSKLVSRWGSLRWDAETPAGTAITVATRSGNVAEPDDTWSDWSPEQTDGQTATVAAPAARFLQYRVTLTTDDPTVTPAVHAVSLRYATANQAPEVTKVEVPDLNAVNVENPKKLKFKWSATDANEDDLIYTLFVRKDGWKSWVELEDDLEKTEYEWDTTTTPSGVYQLKVVASDRKDNPDAEALTGERTSVPFVVCHVAPAVTIKVAGLDGDRAVVEASAASPLVRLTAASFTVNGKKWVNVFPSDGLFDGKSEAFKFTTEALKPGAYVLVLRVRDAAGNTGSGDVVFRVEAPKKSSPSSPEPARP
jgi:sugar lactone lactonase YvrE